jgi:site-specific DNA recombinase
MSAKTNERTSPVRCAIYTRKSSEEGLDQAFNSLHAQREACEAYVKSQVGEGWTTLPAVYDDGGYSGGNLERPALKRLLADITAGRVDTVVVYKIDRLTRSLGDFAKIVDIFDAKGAAFVSVTQAFNTTTSMGRLTLNVLLSFAQFEREVTGERIRDKIAASKAKGMWMGGVLSLGYDPDGRTLRINQAEAETVRSIYRRYLELGSVNRLRDELEQSGIRSKAWTNRAGQPVGGCVIGRGALFHILQNRLYRGEIQHGDLIHPALHPAIIDQVLFDAVQARLAENRVPASTRMTRSAKMLLTGKVFDALGVPMSPSFAYGRGGRIYRYYISMDLQVGRSVANDDVIRRVAADALETFLARQLARIAGRTDLGVAELPAMVGRIELGRQNTQVVLDAAVLFGAQHRHIAFEDLQDRLGPSERAAWEDGEASAVRIVLPMRMQLRGGRTWLNGCSEAPSPASIDRYILRGLRSAHAELLELNVSPLTAVEAFVESKAPIGPQRRQLSRLPFLAPDIQRAILHGEQPAGIRLGALLADEVPLLWTQQRVWFAAMHSRRA